MKIGIGLTTYNRPKHFDLWRRQIATTTPLSYLIYHAADGQPDRKGIAYRKNECLIALKGCDYIFLFDDDCFPIKEGWADYFINASKASGQHHLMYLRETPTIKKIASPHDELIEYNNCAGCMMFITKEVIDKVGGYGKYLNYGYEHAGYSQRIHNAGLTPLGKYTCPAGVGEYIYAMDYDYSRRDEFQKKVGHGPSMKPSEIITQIALSEEYYIRDIQTTHQPL